MSPFFNDFSAPRSTLHHSWVQLSSSAASADRIGITPCGVSTTLLPYLFYTSTDPSVTAWHSPLLYPIIIFMLLLVAKVAQKPPHAPPSGAKSSALHHFGGAVLLLRCKCGPNWNYALRRVYDLAALSILHLNRPLRHCVALSLALPNYYLYATFGGKSSAKATARTSVGSEEQKSLKRMLRNQSV